MIKWLLLLHRVPCSATCLKFKWSAEEVKGKKKEGRPDMVGGLAAFHSDRTRVQEYEREKRNKKREVWRKCKSNLTVDTDK
jgi:hypothetical protein